MDWLTFISEMVKAAAWPVTTVVIALLFREQIISLLKRLKKGKVGPASFEFEEEVKALQEEVESSPLAPRLPSVGRPTVALVASNPRAAVLSAWLKVESEAANLAVKKGLLSEQAARNSGTVIRAIRQAGILPEQYAPLLSELRLLRNKAAHELDFGPSTDSVLSYVQLAEELKDALQQAAL
jgi:hypothetical protein